MKPYSFALNLLFRVIHHTSLIFVTHCVQASSAGAGASGGGGGGRGPKHTIILVQQLASPTTRTYYDFETKSKALEGILKIYEETLKSMFPHRPTITYDISDINSFLDTLFDISALVCVYMYSGPPFYVGAWRSVDRSERLGLFGRLMGGWERRRKPARGTEALH
jgi:hypothetical protein